MSEGRLKIPEEVVEEKYPESLSVPHPHYSPTLVKTTLSKEECPLRVVKTRYLSYPYNNRNKISRPLVPYQTKEVTHCVVHLRSRS